MKNPNRQIFMHVVEDAEDLSKELDLGEYTCRHCLDSFPRKRPLEEAMEVFEMARLMHPEQFSEFSFDDVGEMCDDCYDFLGLDMLKPSYSVH